METITKGSRVILSAPGVHCEELMDLQASHPRHVLEVADTVAPSSIKVKGSANLWPAAWFAPYREAVPVPAAPPPGPPQTVHAHRKARPLARGLLAYFPDALARLADRLDCNALPAAEWIMSDSELVRSLASAWESDELMEEVALHFLATLQHELTEDRRSAISGLFDGFGEALMEVAHVSAVANEQHNPGQPMHWNYGKSADHFDCMLRHHKDAGTIDTDNLRHSAKSTWRALAQMQTRTEARHPSLHAERQAMRDAAARGEAF